MTVAAHKRSSSAQSADMVHVWRCKCMALEEKLEDATRALKASEAARREVSLDYRHALNKLWAQSAGLTTRREW